MHSSGKLPITLATYLHSDSLICPPVVSFISQAQKRTKRKSAHYTKNSNKPMSMKAMKSLKV